VRPVSGHFARRANAAQQNVPVALVGGSLLGGDRIRAIERRQIRHGVLRRTNVCGVSHHH
jgi:hypothetical protein